MPSCLLFGVAHAPKADARYFQACLTEIYVFHEDDPNSVGQFLVVYRFSERCRKTPAITSSTPNTSSKLGIWRSTTTPITLAMAGRRERSRAKVLRARRAMASWSQTYGMTDEQIPTPAPAAMSKGWEKVGQASRMPIGIAASIATSMAAARLSIPLVPPCAAIRCPSTTYSTNNAQFANANRNPAGVPAKRASERT